eukprot:320552-Chlamydomonas_euryale.AAC.13
MEAMAASDLRTSTVASGIVPARSCIPCSVNALFLNVCILVLRNVHSLCLEMLWDGQMEMLWKRQV